MKQRRKLTGDLVLEAATGVLGAAEALRLYGLAVLANRTQRLAPEELRSLLVPYVPNPEAGQAELWRELRQVRQQVRVMTGEDPGPALDVLRLLAVAGSS